LRQQIGFPFDAAEAQRMLAKFKASHTVSEWDALNDMYKDRKSKRSPRYAPLPFLRALQMVANGG